MTKHKVGVIGCGVVGGLLVDHFRFKGNPVLRRDPKHGWFDSMKHAEAVFICIPVPTDSEGAQDIDVLKAEIDAVKEVTDAPIFVRSTVLPGCCDTLGVYAMPEFITERTKNEDFVAHPIYVGGHRDFIKTLFPRHVVTQLTNVECEIGKFAHNCFGALKVSYFNMIHEFCELMEVKYRNVQDVVLGSGYISPVHTKVPGPDGKRGYGGKCFPDNMKAFKKIIPILDEAYRYNTKVRKRPS